MRMESEVYGQCRGTKFRCMVKWKLGGMKDGTNNGYTSIQGGIYANGYTKYREQHCEYNTSCGVKLSIEHISQVSETMHSFYGRGK